MSQLGALCLTTEPISETQQSAEWAVSSGGTVSKGVRRERVGRESDLCTASCLLMRPRALFPDRWHNNPAYPEQRKTPRNKHTPNLIALDSPLHSRFKAPLVPDFEVHRSSAIPTSGIRVMHVSKTPLRGTSSPLSSHLDMPLICEQGLYPIPTLIRLPIPSPLSSFGHWSGRRSASLFHYDALEYPSSSVWIRLDGIDELISFGNAANQLPNPAGPVPDLSHLPENSPVPMIHLDEHLEKT